MSPEPDTKGAAFQQELKPWRSQDVRVRPTRSRPPAQAHERSPGGGPASLRLASVFGGPVALATVSPARSSCLRDSYYSLDCSPATQGQMSGDVHVHSWPCSYYLSLEKQWVPGKLTLTPRSLKFSADRTEEVLVGLPLSSITEIKKESSLFIFSAITVLEKGQSKHWFSSLRPSRNVVFNIIEHFWRELLLSQPGTAANTASPMTRGQELLGLMASSQRRMEDTSKVLHHQGEQLDSVMRGLEKMESDLDVADRLLTELESPSWWPFSSKLWKTPAEAKTKEGVSVAACEPFGKEGVVIRVPAIVSQKTESHSKPGKLTVLVSALEIHDSSSLLLHRFEREDVDDIRVHSPYEVSIRQRFIGKPDVAYRVISAKMPEVIPILEVQFSKKIELLEDALVLRSWAQTAPAEGSCSIRHAASRLMGCTSPRELPMGGQEGEQLQLQRNWPLLSEGEAQELTQILSKLKGLALDTEAELERQDEALDGITMAVDQATLTVDKHNRRMRKLL